MVQDVVLVKAHLDAEEAMQRADAGGYPVWFHDLNAAADALAGCCAGVHTVD